MCFKNYKIKKNGFLKIELLRDIDLENRFVALYCCFLEMKMCCYNGSDT